MERARLAKVFEQGLDRIIGQVLPIARSADGMRWQSGPWFLRRERCYLLPGDSPIGYRLPLDSQPWVASGDYPFVHQPDPTQNFPACRATLRRSAANLPSATLRRRKQSRIRAPAPQRSAAQLPRAPQCVLSRATACCTSSCRRRRNSNTTWNWSPRWRRPPRSFISPSSWKATNRRATRACSRDLSRHAGSGRDRDQYSSLGQLGGACGTHHVSI